ncbi:interleukin-17F-like [Xenopus laevis]|uniref:Interleukin-17F-like n=1 Tax=Xenopus laevis TaxID=8355 RepID=A0A8J1KS09_XENLA|nr:interleukin-17F-like [Xenopus laevis]
MSPILSQVYITLLGICTMAFTEALLPHSDCQLPLDFPPVVRASIGSGGQIRSLRIEIRNRSLSPWDYIINMDKNRFPAALNEASCLHRGCLDEEGNIDLNLVSSPIRQEILVLRREVKGCTTSFWLEKQTVTVGCTWSMSSTIPSKRISDVQAPVNDKCPLLSKTGRPVDIPTPSDKM